MLKSVGPLDEAKICAALTAWPQAANCTVQLLNYSENHTFRLDGPEGPRFTLRVHRPGYQSDGSIRSELAWLEALGRQTDLALARPMAGADGDYLQRIELDGDDHRFAVLFEFAPGGEPSPADDQTALFETIGRYGAVLHSHAEGWSRPAGFERQIWDAGQILDADGLWGDWRSAPGVGRAIAPVLHELDAALRQDLATYGTAARRFGLIHADLRFGNLLADADRVTLIDFDDCGFCWFAYDFAAAISFYECHPTVPQWRAAWLKGYTAHRQLDADDLAAMETMILLRRMALLAWIGSHAETQLAQTHMPGFAEGTAQLARDYLDQRRLAVG